MNLMVFVIAGFEVRMLYDEHTDGQGWVSGYVKHCVGTGAGASIGRGDGCYSGVGLGSGSGWGYGSGLGGRTRHGYGSGIGPGSGYGRPDCDGECDTKYPRPVYEVFVCEQH